MKRVFLLLFLGTAVFAGLFRFTPLGFLLSSLAGIGAMILARIVMNTVSPGDKKSSPARISVPGQENAAASVKDGVNKIREISNRARLIQSNQVAQKIREICRTGMEIFDYLQKNPGDRNKARQFYNYYVDATKKIVDQYVDLSTRKEKSAEIDATLAKVEGLLDGIKSTYDRQLTYLYEHDLIDLNAEITLLKKTMELEK